jgi:hypothetical protein
MTYPPGSSVPPVRPKAWLPDPLDDALLRYWDDYRWTFHTVRPSAVPAAVSPPDQSVAPPATLPARRPDIAAALERARGALVGSMKEVNLLESYLQTEERVLALTGAQGEGLGVLACTNRRLIFLFVGLVRKQFLQVNWNEAKHVLYNRPTKTFAVYTTKPTKRAIPAIAVRVNNVADAKMIASTAQATSAAPRLDFV